MMKMPTLGGDNSFAASANNRRQVVGWAEGSQIDPTCVKAGDREFKAVRWDLNSGRLVELPPLDIDSASAATAVSDRGHVVGISGDCDQSIGRWSAKHAVLWHGRSVKDLGNIAGETWNTPTAITPSGDIVVGFVNAIGASPDAPRFRAWLWTERDDIACSKLPGTNMCDLGTLDAGGTAQAWGVNSRGQVVGTSCPPSGNCKAFLWQNGSMTDLNSSKGDYPLNLENAMDISDTGLITGRARTTEGFVAYMAIPRQE
jgi:probable HAF family extracellular repeat protein